MKLHLVLPYGIIFTVVATQLIQNQKSTCPQECYKCKNEDNESKTLCTRYCSSYRWCGPLYMVRSTHRRAHPYTNCTLCKSPTENTFMLHYNQENVTSYYPKRQRPTSSDNKNTVKFAPSQQSPNNLKSQPSLKNILLNYLLPICITVVVIVLIIISVRKYTLLGRNFLPCLSLFGYGNLSM